MKVQSIVPLLNVVDVDRTCTFYERIFGFKVVNKASNDGRTVWAQLSSGELLLMVNHHAEGSARRLAELADHHDIVLYIAVEDAAQVHREARRRRLQVGELEWQEYGVLQFSLHDPDGYELAVTGPLLEERKTASTVKPSSKSTARNSRRRSTAATRRQPATRQRGGNKGK